MTSREGGSQTDGGRTEEETPSQAPSSPAQTPQADRVSCLPPSLPLPPPADTPSSDSSSFFFFFLTIRSFPSPRTLISGLELNSAQRPLYHPSSCVRLTSPLGCRPSSLLPSFSPHPLFPVPLGGRRNNVPGQPESPSCGPTSPHALQAGLALSPHLSEAAIL